MERHAYFDNAKLLLIFLVVFGHMIQPFVSQSHQLKRYIHGYILSICQHLSFWLVFLRKVQGI